MTTFKYISSGYKHKTHVNQETASAAYLVSLSIESVFERDDIRVEKLLHNLELPVLVALVLINFLNRNDFSSLSDSCLCKN